MTKLFGIMIVVVLHTPSWSITGDLDRDGDVDFDDFFLFSDNFGKTGEVEVSQCGEENRELLAWSTHWDDGSVKDEYQYYHHPENNRRIQHGWYNSYYQNGEYLEGGTYKGNERDGEWTYFTWDGKETKGIYENGRKWSGEFWINVKVDTLGSWIETEDEIGDENEVFRGLFTYHNGLWDGLGVLYWGDGDKRGEGLFEDGNHEGYFRTFWSNGNFMWDGNHVDGKKQGKWVWYQLDGKIRYEENYVDGKKEGARVEYYESGKVEEERNYVDGKLDGNWVSYDEEGKIEDADIYENGVCVDLCEEGD